MTVQTNTNVAIFNGNGVTQIFPIAFKFNNDTDLVVLLVDDDTGVSSLLTLNSDYTVSGEGDEEGGLINVVVAPAVGQRLKVSRIVDILQLRDLRNQGKFFAEVHEDAFDLLTMIAQQHESSIRSALRVAESDPEPARLPPVASRANQLLSFDALGNPIATAPASGSSSDLAVALADSVDPAKGAGMIGFQGGTVSGRLVEIGNELAAFIKKTDGPIFVASRNGVDVTGATDGAPALNQLLQDVPSGSLVIIDGLMRANSTILIPKEGVSIRGLNRKSSGIRNYGVGPIIQSATQDTQTLKFTSLSDMLLMKDASAADSAFLVDLKSMQFTSVERVSILGAASGQAGIRMEAQATAAHVTAGTATECSYNYVRDCTINGCTDCVTIRNVANSNTLENVRCQPGYSGGYGVRLVVTDGTYVNNIRIISCSCEYPGKISNGLFVGAAVSGVTILGCRFESMNLGVYIDAAAGDVWIPRRGNYFSSCNTNVNNNGGDTYQGVVGLLRFVVSGGAVTITRQSGIASVAYTAAGTYTVTFKENLGSDYVPIATSSNPQTEVVSLGGTSLQVRTRNSSGTLTDASHVLLQIEK